MPYSYDRTAAGSSSARDTVKSQKSAVEASEKALKKLLPTLARIPGMAVASGAVDSATNHLKSAAEELGKAADHLADAANR